MNLKEFQEWDELNPNFFVKVVLKDGRVFVGLIKNAYRGDPNYQGGGVQTEDHFYLQVGQESLRI